MVFRVKQTAQATQDLDNILAWLIERESGERGLRWFTRLQDALLSLSEMPQRCSLAPENKKFPFEVRQLLYGRRPHQYRVLFTIDGDTVVILHIRHGRRRRLGEID